MADSEQTNTPQPDAPHPRDPLDSLPPVPPKPASPVCYRHPERETWVKCGRCGKPLCPDCMLHGPVGVRCRECLLPQGRGTGLISSGQFTVALRGALLVALASLAVMVLLSLFVTSRTFGGLAPNLLVSAACGGFIGWTIWRTSYGRYNTMTIRAAVLLALAVPIVAALLVAGWQISRGESWMIQPIAFSIRTLAAAGLCAFMAWLLASNSTA